MNPTILHSAMRGGLVLGIFFSLNFIFSASGVVVLALLTYPLIGLIIYAMYRYTVHYRNEACGGTIRFNHALAYVLLLAIFATLISSFVKFFYLKYINTTFLENTYNQSITVFEHLFPQVTDDMYKAMETLTNPQGYTMMAAWTNLFFALLIGLIIAAAVKKTPGTSD